MTIEERAERFYKFESCLGITCAECSYGGSGICKDAIHEDAVELLKHETLKREAAEEVARTIKSMDNAATIAEDMKPRVYKAPLTMDELKEIKKIINDKTSYEDMSYHLIQEINELCVELNHLAAAIGKYEQIQKGTDPVGKAIDRGELCNEIANGITAVIREAVDVRNYICLSGYENELAGWFEKCEEKLARWANRLNGVSDE